jgi:iron complex outermembrane recepter protein
VKEYFFILYFLLLFSFFSLNAQQELFSIQGTILDSDGEALPGATIFIHEINRGTSANVDGHYEIRGLRRGPYHLHVTHLGHEAISHTIVIANNDLEKDFILYPSSLELKGIVVEASPFKSGPVEQSLTVETVERDFIEKNSSITFVNALQKLPGINAINTGVGIAKPMIRGLSFNRVMVNDKGIKQEGQQWGQTMGWK